MRHRALHIERQEARHDLVVAEVRRPAVGAEHCDVEPPMGLVELIGALVAQVGPGAALGA